MSWEGAIFDLDGTLLDSMYIWDEAPGRLVRRYGGGAPEGLAEAVKEMGRREASDYLIRRFALPCTVEAAMAAIDELVDGEYRERVPVKPGAGRLLQALADRKIPCAIATASEVYQARDALERLGLWRHFQFAVSSIDYGPKTGPGVYHEAARRLHSAPERTLVFEDALHAARAAKEAGFRVAAVYDPSAEGDQAALRALCDWYLPRLDDEVFLHVLD